MTSDATGGRAAVADFGGAPPLWTVTAGDAVSAEERWARWLDKGAAHEQRMNDRMRYVTALVVAGLLAWLAFAIATA
jgi:hypothetical protein